MFSKKRDLYCQFCLTDLWHEHTFIKCATVDCAELEICVCLQCFANGKEDGVHKNTDPYQVVCNAVEIDENLWYAHEEITLLDTFMDTMSWEKVAQKLDRSPKECERHYYEHFILNPKIKGLESVNSKAFRLEKFGIINDNGTKTIGDTLNLEGTHINS